eukprot:6175869-Pleurochrysis_carterae.AAC.13
MLSSTARGRCEVSRAEKSWTNGHAMAYGCGVSERASGRVSEVVGSPGFGGASTLQSLNVLVKRAFRRPTP